MDTIFGKGIVFAVIAILLPFFALAEIRSEISIDVNGKVTAKNIKVTMIPELGKSRFFYTRALWDKVFIRMTVLTNDATAITKQHGEKATVFDIKEGDIINVEGTLPDSADALNIQATKIVDTSLLVEEKDVRGTVTGINADSSSFIIKTLKGNIITVNTLGLTQITKGVRTISFSEILKGDNVTSVKGAFDYGTYTISATNVVVYQDKKIFVPRNFQGTLKSISGSSLPATLSVDIDGKDYTVYLSGKTTLINKARSSISLSRFVIGDILRFYGAVRQTDLSSIDAEILRDMNF